jgi:hypothetical protein
MMTYKNTLLDNTLPIITLQMIPTKTTLRGVRFQEQLTDVGDEPTDPERDQLRRFQEQLTGTEATLPISKDCLFLLLWIYHKVKQKGRGVTAQLAHVVAREDGNNHLKYYYVILIESPPI